MAIYHLNLKTLGRSQGRSATGAAAYRAGVQIADRVTGLVFDYTRKRGCDGAEILAPSDAPGWVQERAELWNRVEEAEKRKDAQLAREVEFALPIELTPEQMKDTARAFVAEQFVARGMVADLAFHHLDTNNPHAHCLLTMRALAPDGFGPKVREWNDRALCDLWREAWARHANAALAGAGRGERIDHRTLDAQALDALEGGAIEAAKALDRLPTIHAARDRAAILHNRAVQAANAARQGEWAKIENEARAQARLMLANSDHRPPPAAPKAGACPAPPRLTLEAQDTRFCEEMGTAPGLAAIQWRAADARATALRRWLDDHRHEAARRCAERDKAAQTLVAARVARQQWRHAHPKPAAWWIFNRQALAAWEAAKRQQDRKVKRCAERHAEAAKAADAAALHALEQERETTRKALGRALAERRRWGLLPSERQERLAERRAGRGKHLPPPSPAPEMAPAPNAAPTRRGPRLG